MEKTPTEWAKALINKDTVNSVASRCEGLTQPTLYRQLQKNTVTVETVIALARGYGKSAIQALIECGFITKEDLAHHKSIGHLKDATDEELVEEVLRRIKEGSTSFD